MYLLLGIMLGTPSKNSVTVTWKRLVWCHCHWKHCMWIIMLLFFFAVFRTLNKYCSLWNASGVQFRIFFEAALHDWYNKFAYDSAGWQCNNVNPVWLPCVSFRFCLVHHYIHDHTRFLIFERYLLDGCENMLGRQNLHEILTECSQYVLSNIFHIEHIVLL